MIKIHPAIRTTLTMDSGDGDVFGWGMDHWFDVAETLHRAGETIPTSWQYVPSPVMLSHEPESIFVADLSADLREGAITPDDLRRAGDVLGRYIQHVKFHGTDY